MIALFRFGYSSGRRRWEIQSYEITTPTPLCAPQSPIPNPSSSYDSATGFTGRVVIAKRDPLAAEFLRQAVVRALGPVAEIELCHVAHAALEALRARPAVLGIFGLSFPDLDGLDLLEQAAEDRLVWRTLVVTGRNDERAQTRLQRCRVACFACGQSVDGGRLQEAIRSVAAGARIIPPSEMETTRRSSPPPLDQLMTEHEQLVFSALGDGCDDDTAAARLGSCANTVRWYRTRIMRKLGVQCRGDLVREAVRRGVVRFSSGRVMHPGFERELAVLRTRAHLRVTPAA